jgi:hypothetical protein
MMSNSWVGLALALGGWLIISVIFALAVERMTAGKSRNRRL